ncbi:MAG: pyridoxamine 5-phosphate oxidase-related, FMN-binding protein [Marmoricola sp.]|jgi:nitroimidazol reductase NimA-like FMN-containing flavoprotein (pyridoxamine 5'-phosphate oxidase superfamily)|nr:pyridoxamine 5-phosphate oxidase-related, FMN-binding protein [Marmoricola sp.]
MAETRDLDTGQCQALLRLGVTGRVALLTPTGPHIVPVNYSVVDDAVIMRTSPYSLLGTYGRDTTVAFEIDAFDRTLERGWSVLARGRVEAVTDRRDLEHIREVAEPQPWASGGRSLYLRLRWTEMSGRQLGTHWDPLLDVPG